MGTSVYTSLLIKDFSRKSGEIKKLRKELREMARVVLAHEAELAALVTVIKSREPDFNPQSIKAKVTTPRVLGLQWNLQTTLILEALRKAEGRPVSTNELTDYVVFHGGIVIENRRTHHKVWRCIYSTLKRLARKSQIQKVANDGSTDALVHWVLPSSK